MKNKVFTKQNLRSAFIIFYLFVMIAGLSYAYLVYKTAKTDDADAKDFRIPYTAVPDNCDMLFAFPSGRGCILRFNFKSKIIEGIMTDDADENPLGFSGFEPQYTVSADYQLIAGIIDRVGGIELETDGEVLRYTGVQIIDMLSLSAETQDLSYDIILAIFKKISQNGFSDEDFSYIIEYGRTDLTLPVCYDWDKYIKEMCGKVNILR